MHDILHRILHRIVHRILHRIVHRIALRIASTVCLAKTVCPEQAVYENELLAIKLAQVRLQPLRIEAASQVSKGCNPS